MPIQGTNKSLLCVGANSHWLHATFFSASVSWHRQRLPESFAFFVLHAGFLLVCELPAVPFPSAFLFVHHSRWVYAESDAAAGLKRTSSWTVPPLVKTFCHYLGRRCNTYHQVLQFFVAFVYVPEQVLFFQRSYIVKPCKGGQFFLIGWNLCHRIQRSDGLRHPHFLQFAFR